MKVLVVLALAWCCSGRFIIPYTAQPYPWAVRYQSTDIFGQSTFGHQSIDQTRHEVRLADGRVIGQFSYIDANGEPAVTYFEAGSNGYRVLGSNILPEAPVADLKPPVDNLVAPEPVGYTPEVLKARAEFMEIYEKAAAGISVESPEEESKVEPEDEKPASTFTVPTEAEETPLDDVSLSVDVSAEEKATTAEDKVAVSEGEEEVSRQKRQVLYTVPVGTPISSPIISIPAAKSVKEEEDEDGKVIAIHHPFYTFPTAFLPQSHYFAGLPIVLNNPTSSPDTTSRSKRDASTIRLPYLHPIPIETEAVLKTKQFETDEAAATPADTTKIELTTKEHVFNVPGVKFVQPVVEVKPLQYTTSVLPQVLQYPTTLPFYPLGFPGLPYHTVFTPAAVEEE